MKQRLALASALLCDPRVMILDEPTNGLDPRGIAEIRDLILTIASKGKTIILASHLLDEVQKVCSHFAVLNKGRLLYSGLVNDVSGDEQRIELAADDVNQLYSLLENYPGKKNLEVQDKRIIITLPGDTSVTHLSSYIYQHGVVPTHLVTLHRSLEKQFLDILNESK
jgi:ABC-2 type transport system ATP-binding protein